MVLTFTENPSTVTVTTSETDIITLTTEQYQGVWLFLQNLSTNDIVVRIYIFNTKTSTYNLFEAITITGTITDTAKYIPLLPARQFKISVQRTIGANFNIDYDIVEQNG